MKRNSVPASVWRNPIHFLAFGCGAGAAGYAPGTWGTLVAIPVYYLLQGMPLFWYLAIISCLFLLGVWLCERTARDIGVHDHAGIVWDEIVGYLLSMTAAPRGFLWVAVGFAAFRLFDIWKPWPVRWCDRRVGGGLGIMLDDILAAVYAWLLLQLVAVISLV